MIKLEAKNMIDCRSELDEYQKLLITKANYSYPNYNDDSLTSFINSLKSMDVKTFFKVSDRFNEISNRFVVDLPYTANYVANNIEVFDKYVLYFEKYLRVVEYVCSFLMKKFKNNYDKVLVFYNGNIDLVNNKVIGQFDDINKIDDEMFITELHSKTTAYIQDTLERMHNADVQEIRLKTPLARGKRKNAMVYVNRIDNKNSVNK